jgi:hypothetical protein
MNTTKIIYRSTITANIRNYVDIHAENLLVDDGSHREAVEAIRECFPQLDIVSSLACRPAPHALKKKKKKVIK